MYINLLLKNVSLSNSTNIHCVDCTNEPLNNSIHRKCSFENKNLDKNGSWINEEISPKQKKGKFSFLNQNCNALILTILNCLRIVNTMTKLLQIIF